MRINDISTWSPPWVENRQRPEERLNEEIALCYALGDADAAAEAWKRHTGDDEAGEATRENIKRLGPSPF